MAVLAIRESNLNSDKSFDQVACRACLSYIRPMRTLIVGAGLTGLIIANRLKSSSEVVVLEKSRGVGGRMATRRTDTAKFDHGAQFYKLREPIEILHDEWEEDSLVTPWFESDGVMHFKCSNGMTTLAKDLAVDLDIKLETRAEKLSTNGTSWKIVCENQESFIADQLILTCPLPQALEILRTSGVKYDIDLDAIQYAKAIVVLIESESIAKALTGAAGYREPESGDIFSIADQQTKGLSKVPALTVTLKPKVSERLYDMPDDTVTELVLAELKKLDPGFTVKSLQIKKWRYSHPLRMANDFYVSPKKGLFLAGDAFGGPSLNGAARSADALADFLTGPEDED